MVTVMSDNIILLERSRPNLEEFFSTVPADLNEIIVIGQDDDGTYWKFSDNMKMSTALYLLETMKARVLNAIMGGES